MITIFHIATLATKAAHDKVNRVGWDGAPEFRRYCDITHNVDRDAATIALLEGEYVKVAVVDTDSLEEAWALTNHIESDWTENEKVTALPSLNGQRSSMVGDLFIKSDGKPSVFIVDRMGFTPLVDTE